MELVAMKDDNASCHQDQIIVYGLRARYMGQERGEAGGRGIIRPQRRSPRMDNELTAWSRSHFSPRYFISGFEFFRV